MNYLFLLGLFATTASALTLTQALGDVTDVNPTQLLPALAKAGLDINAILNVQEVCAGRGISHTDPPAKLLKDTAYTVENGTLACTISVAGKTSLNYHFPRYGDIACAPSQAIVGPAPPCYNEFFIYNDKTFSEVTVQTIISGALGVEYFAGFLGPVVAGVYQGRQSLTLMINNPVSRAIQTLQCATTGAADLPADYITIIY